uniref:Uncharacterized protein n=1 Tax=Rhizophora mucronata TaxID=61149 RepID=A0A2P2P929_RHIMU
MLWARVCWSFSIPCDRASSACCEDWWRLQTSACCRSVKGSICGMRI